MKIELKPELLLAIQQQLGERQANGMKLEPFSRISAGQINSTAIVRQGPTKYFVKLNAAAMQEMFAAERDALKELRLQSALRVPRPIALGSRAGVAFLVIEHLDLRSRGDAAALGTGLAAIHSITAEQFGWHRNNTIGTTPQDNQFGRDWPQFWARRRLGYQLDLAAHNGHPELRDQATELMSRPALFFDTYHPVPSLLHGDLWRGNFAYLANGAPVIYDPASYYGDRETDLAMTELFGGFDTDFYAAYSAHAPLDPGYGVRKYYYQLYHVLNHLNLFGGAYLAQAGNLLSRLLSETR